MTDSRRNGAPAFTNRRFCCPCMLVGSASTGTGKRISNTTAGLTCRSSRTALNIIRVGSAELNNPAMQAGGFGENFTISSVNGAMNGAMNETTVCIGDRFVIGAIELEVSQPREPCFKLVRRWKQPDLAKRVLEHNRGGWYLRVIREGIVATGDPVRRIANPFPRWTIAAAMQVMYHPKNDPKAADALACCPALSERWQLQMRKRLAS